ncbi:MAG: hypothetical protein NC911_10900 [Candidatus Omnitrophica bacterium]|nr:hypothetical protein [Candidatus Omnitrophota bacterium]
MRDWPGGSRLITIGLDGWEMVDVLDTYHIFHFAWKNNQELCGLGQDR